MALGVPSLVALNEITGDPIQFLQGKYGTFIATPVRTDGSKGDPQVYVSKRGHSVTQLIQPGVQFWQMTQIGTNELELNQQQLLSEQQEYQQQRSNR